VIVLSTSSTPLVAWNTLWRILEISLVAGLAISLLIAIGIRALSASRADGAGSIRIVYQAVVVLAAAAAAFLVLWGLYLIVHKS
jgi:hypothetical protein